MHRPRSNTAGAVENTSREPRFYLALNPYLGSRFSKCPGCRNAMKARKVPLLIHIHPHQLVSLRLTVKVCEQCDLLLVHQNDLEEQLYIFAAERAPHLIGNEYVLLGTVDMCDWKTGMRESRAPLEELALRHPFRGEMEVRVRQGGWYPKGKRPPLSKNTVANDPNRLWQRAEGETSSDQTP
jgi:hypothetical protein